MTILSPRAKSLRWPLSILAAKSDHTTQVGQYWMEKCPSRDIQERFGTCDCYVEYRTKEDSLDVKHCLLNGQKK